MKTFRSNLWGLRGPSSSIKSYFYFFPSFFPFNKILTFLFKEVTSEGFKELPKKEEAGSEDKHFVERTVVRNLSLPPVTETPFTGSIAQPHTWRNFSSSVRPERCTGDSTSISSPSWWLLVSFKLIEFIVISERVHLRTGVATLYIFIILFLEV